MILKEHNRKISDYLHSLGKTTEDVAKVIGMTQQQASNLVSGRNAFQVKNAVLVGRAFGLSPAWLITGEGEMLLDPDAKFLDRVEIGRQVAAFMKANGLRNADVARMTGKNANALCLILRGKIPLALNYARKLGKCLGMSVNWLLTGEGEMLNGEKPEYDITPSGVVIPAVGGDIVSRERFDAMAAERDAALMEVERLKAQVRKLLGVIATSAGLSPSEGGASAQV